MHNRRAYVCVLLPRLRWGMLLPRLRCESLEALPAIVVSRHFTCFNTTQR
jgi:hypothetical protein